MMKTYPKLTFRTGILMKEAIAPNSVNTFDLTRNIHDELVKDEDSSQETLLSSEISGSSVIASLNDAAMLNSTSHGGQKFVLLRLSEIV